MVEQARQSRNTVHVPSGASSLRGWSGNGEWKQATWSNTFSEISVSVPLKE